MSMSMSNMSVVFAVSSTTTLYFSSWTPSTTGQYAATCIFIIVLAAIFRALLAFKSVQEHRWTDSELNRREMVRLGKRTKKVSDGGDSTAKKAVLSANGVKENVVVVQRRVVARAPWRLSVDVPRALLDTLIAFVGYLLMLTVMTANVGYFMSILGGTYLGSMIAGRYIQSSSVSGLLI